MVLPDVNVLIHAFRPEHPRRPEFVRWLECLVNGHEAFALSEIVLSGFVRIVTHPRIFEHPDPIREALAFASQVRSQPHCVLVTPGPRHWAIFADLCKRAEAKGNLVPDAYLAALAIETWCEWVTTDRDFARFPGLRWRHPLDDG